MGIKLGKKDCLYIFIIDNCRCQIRCKILVSPNLLVTWGFCPSQCVTIRASGVWLVAPPRARAIYFLQGNKELGVVCPDLDKKDKGKYLLV